MSYGDYEVVGGYDYDVSGESEDDFSSLLQSIGAVSPMPKLNPNKPIVLTPQILAAMKKPTFVRPKWMGPVGMPQGVSRVQEDLDPLPFEAVTLTDAAPAQDMTAFPQRPFRGERLTFVAILLTGGVASDGSPFVVIDPAIFVGATQVGTSQGAMPIGAYVANSFGNRMSWPSAGQGTRIFMPLRLLAPIGVGNSLIVTASVMGRAVR